MALVQRKMLTIEMAEDYSGYTALMLRAAVRRGELKAERPGGSPRSRLYFEQGEIDRWLDSIAASA